MTLDSVRLWLAQLERLYYCYRILPYAGKLARSLRRKPKLYLHDWSEIPEEGKRFENMMASALSRWCNFAQDWGQEKLGLHFVRDKEKREVDFLLTHEGKPQLLVEARLSDLQPSAALHYFAGKAGGNTKVARRCQCARAWDCRRRARPARRGLPVRDPMIMSGQDWLAASMFLVHCSENK